METQDYTASITVNATAQEVFDTINNVTTWWTGDLQGRSHNVGDEFTVLFEDKHISSQKLTEVTPHSRVVWLVTASRLNFVEDKSEWTNTTISFDIASHNNQTEIIFTHHGLVPSLQCYNGCSKGWDYFIKGSLFKLLTEGKGTPGLTK